MARDYARPPQRPASRPSNRDTKGGGARSSKSKSAAASSGVPGWVWMMAGLSVGLLVAALVWIDRQPKSQPIGSAVVTGTAPGSIGKSIDPNATIGRDDGRKTSIALPPKQPSRFAFYEMLPSYEVVIPHEDAVAANKTGKATTPAVQEAIAAPGQYLIQVGAYKTRDEAEKSRASLALLGVESKIEQVTINSAGNGGGDQNTTWFRVRIGPEDTLPKAQDILDRLQSNDIKAMLVKVKAG